MVTQYYRQLDALRAFAAFGVINLHWLNSGYPLLFGIEHESMWSFGHFGVQLFFVLSGFLITSILISNKNSSFKGVVVRNFFVRRVLRLFPVYYLFLVFLVIVKDKFVIQNIGWFVTYTANFKFYHAGGLVDVWSNHLWTLSIEEQFYLIFPFLFLFIPKKYDAIIPITLIISSLVYKSINSGTEHIHLLTLSQMDMLGAGVGLAMIKNRSEKWFERLTGKAGVSLMLITLLSCLVIFYGAEESSVSWHIFDYLLVIAFTLLVAITARGFSGFIGRVFENSILTYLGKVSYGLYLYHKVVPLTLLILLTKLDVKIDNIAVYYVTNLIILLAVTHLSWMLIEKPLLKLKSKFEYPAHTHVPKGVVG